MRKWTKTAGLLFLAAASVYTSRAIVAAAEGEVSSSPTLTDTHVAFVKADTSKTAAPAAKAERFVAAPAEATEVKLLEESTDPFAAGGAATQPAAGATTQPGDG